MANMSSGKRFTIGTGGGRLLWAEATPLSSASEHSRQPSTQRIHRTMLCPKPRAPSTAKRPEINSSNMRSFTPSQMARGLAKAAPCHPRGTGLAWPGSHPQAPGPCDDRPAPAPFGRSIRPSVPHRKCLQTSRPLPQHALCDFCSVLFWLLFPVWSLLLSLSLLSSPQ